MKSLFPYVGGKHRVAGKLIRLFPEHSCYVEVFGGALNILLNKPKLKSEVINDVNRDLVNIFRVIRFHPDEFHKELILMTHSRQEYNDALDQPGLTDVQRAARFWYRLKTTFGGTGVQGHRNFHFGSTGSGGFKPAAWDTVLQAHERLAGVIIENDDFAAVLRRYDREFVFFFCDPPYWQAADYGRPFTWQDHQRLEQCLREIKGKFMLTINDHPDIRKLYAGLPLMVVKVQYSISRDKSATARERNELIITNYRLPRRC